MILEGLFVPVVGPFTDSDCNINLIFAIPGNTYKTLDHSKHKSNRNEYLHLIRSMCSLSNVSKLKVDANLEPDE